LCGVLLPVAKAFARDELFRKLEQEARYFGARGRTHFGRKRPQALDARIKPVFDGLSDPCYPSGNSTPGMLYAILLAELAPAQREAILERGREIGWNRVIAGVHYPSDVTAGRVLAVALARALLTSPTFQEEFSKVREELDAVRRTQRASR
jgi:acid phosphatase (class A)